MKRTFIFLILLSFNSCSQDQEPIYHLFKHSLKYPEYRETEYLKDRGFKTEVIDDKVCLTNNSGNIKLFFRAEEDTYSLIRKTTRVFLDKFDSLKADNEIERKFKGRRIENWKIVNDSLWTTNALFLGDIYQITMKRDKNPYLETTVDLFHRVSVCP